MKKILISLTIFGILTIAGCTELNRIKITRTVSANIPLVYNINKVGDFYEYSRIDTDDIINKFDFNDRFFYNEGKIEKFEVHSVGVGATLGANNTAKQVQLKAQISSNSIFTEILNESKVITLVDDKFVDFTSGLGNIIGVNKEKVTLNNAITALNADGVRVLQETMEKSLGLKQINLRIYVSGKVPANQRMVMTLAIQINATLTYSKCEETLGIIATDYECKRQ